MDHNQNHKDLKPIVRFYQDVDDKDALSSKLDVAKLIVSNLSRRNIDAVREIFAKLKDPDFTYRRFNGLILSSFDLEIR